LSEQNVHFCERYLGSIVQPMQLLVTLFLLHCGLRRFVLFEVDFMTGSILVTFCSLHKTGEVHQSCNSISYLFMVKICQPLFNTS
jgi:hypothetical protein